LLSYPGSGKFKLLDRLLLHCPKPPPTQITSKGGQFAKVVSGKIIIPSSVLIGSTFSDAMNLDIGKRTKTCWGQYRAVMPGNDQTNDVLL